MSEKANKYIKIAIFILIVSIVCMFSYVIRNNSNVNKDLGHNIEELNHNEVMKLSKLITDDIVSGKEKQLAKYSHLFNKETLAKYRSYIADNIITGQVDEIVTDFANPDYSTSQDTVLFINFKVSKKSDKNTIYMIELHINKEGKIYGFNVWGY